MKKGSHSSFLHQVYSVLRGELAKLYKRSMLSDPEGVKVGRAFPVTEDDNFTMVQNRISESGEEREVTSDGIFRMKPQRLLTVLCRVRGFVGRHT